MKKTELYWQIAAVLYILGHLILREMSFILVTTALIGFVIAGGNVVVATKFFREAKEEKFWSAVVVAGLVAIVAAWDLYRMA